MIYWKLLKTHTDYLVASDILRCAIVRDFFQKLGGYQIRHQLGLKETLQISRYVLASQYLLNNYQINTTIYVFLV